MAARWSGVGYPGSAVRPTPERVDPSLIEHLLDAGYLPVVAPLCLDEQGLPCNVNADEVAAALASALKGRLVLLTDTDGVRGSDGARIAALTSAEAEGLIADGTIAGGMVPKVRAALGALDGASEAVIADGAAEGALSRALGRVRERDAIASLSWIGSSSAGGLRAR